MDRKGGKRQKYEAKTVKVKLLHLTQPRGGHILHEQEHNTGHGIQAIHNEICREIWRQPSKPEIQQKPLVYLLLESAKGRKRGDSGLPLRTVGLYLPPRSDSVRAPCIDEQGVKSNDSYDAAPVCRKRISASAFYRI